MPSKKHKYDYEGKLMKFPKKLRKQINHKDIYDIYFLSGTLPFVNDKFLSNYMREILIEKTKPILLESQTVVLRECRHLGMSEIVYDYIIEKRSSDLYSKVMLDEFFKKQSYCVKRIREDFEVDHLNNEELFDQIVLLKSSLESFFDKHSGKGALEIENIQKSNFLINFNKRNFFKLFSNYLRWGDLYGGNRWKNAGLALSKALASFDIFESNGSVKNFNCFLVDFDLYINSIHNGDASILETKMMIDDLFDFRSALDFKKSARYPELFINKISSSIKQLYPHIRKDFEYFSLISKRPN